MPTVSIIIPCYNEQATIPLLLEALYRQEFPLQEMEIIIADGFSTDGTRNVITHFQRTKPHLQIQLIDNPDKNIPAGLNRALEASRGEYIIRLDAHAVPGQDYVMRCVKALKSGLGDNVGGVWDIQPGRDNWIARSIAVAAAHPLGVGDAQYRFTDRPQPVDTVPFGAFHRSLIERVGRFDETLLANEDYEFNARIRQNGGRVWLDPAIRTTYFARPTLKALARQYARYGYWKGQMLRRYPETLRWRQVLPPLFVLSLAGLAIAGFWLPWAWGILGLEVTLYGSALLLAGIQAAIQKRTWSLAIGVPIAIATMHFSWGSALLRSLLSRR